MIKQVLVEVDFHVCCNDKVNTTKASKDITDAINKFNCITKMTVVKSDSHVNYLCVIGKAKIKASMRKQFEKELLELKCGGEKKITTSQVLLPLKVEI